MPRVTVIMATYNWAPVLPYSIGSVLDQTFTDLELLVIGDRCTDESADVVAAIGDPRVQWHNLGANTGCQAGPNNEGLRLARGEVIAYLGHDDLWLPRHLEVLVGAVDGGARIAHAATLWVAPDRRPAVWPAATWIYERGSWIPPTTVAHDRAVAEAVGGWRLPVDTGTLASEADLWQRITAVSRRPLLVPRVTSIKLPAANRRAVYRDRPNHEQAYWLRRIRGAGDPERSLLAACNERYVYADPSWRSQSRRILRAVRWRLRVRTRLRSLGLLPPAPVSFEESLAVVRRFKGVDD